MFDTLLFLSVDGLTNGAIYALLGLGIVLIYAVTRVINIAHGDFAMLGALTLVSLEGGRMPATLALLCGGLMLWTALDVWRLRDVPRQALRVLGHGAFVIAAVLTVTWLVLYLEAPRILMMALAVVLVAMLGTVFHRLAIEPIPHASVLVYIIVTLGAHLVIQGLALNLWGPQALAVEPMAQGVASFGPVTVSAQSLLVVAVAAVLFATLFVYFRHSLHGKALRAASLNRLGAELCGVRVAWAGRTAFFVAAALAAVAGILIAPMVGVHYEMGFLVGLKGFVGATLGGLISYPGAIVGGLLIGLLESAFSFTLSAYRDALVFLMIVPVLIVRTARMARKGVEAEHAH